MDGMMLPGRALLLGSQVLESLYFPAPPKEKMAMQAGSRWGWGGHTAFTLSLLHTTHFTSAHKIS